jgi:threonylcarbamoyladenosine tRNA methylthiotransferase MtaB
VVAVTGCYAQIAPQEIEKIEGVDIVIGTNNRNKIVELVEKVINNKDLKLNIVGEVNDYKEFEELPTPEIDKVRAFIKIQEGCNRFCTYCIIPYARGPIRSRKPERIIKEIKDLVSTGYSEVVLTGIHTALYGSDFKDENINLSSLIEQIVDINGLKRLRVGSIDPDDFSEQLLSVLTENEIICPHYHISLQSGDDKILKKMGRRYNTEDFRQIVDVIIKKRPEAAVTTDVMVGFPGEDEINFRNTYEFLKDIRFSDLHVFKFSPRKGTLAAEMKEQVANSIKNTRSKKIISLSEELFKKYAEDFLGKSRKVLVERKTEDGYWEGHTDNYLMVRFKSDEKKNLSGNFVDVRLKGIKNKKIIGQI